MEVDGRPRALATGSPQVNTVDLAALVGVADVEDPRVAGERSLNLVEEGAVFSPRAVGVEPGEGREGLAGLELAGLLAGSWAKSEPG